MKRVRAAGFSIVVLACLFLSCSDDKTKRDHALFSKVPSSKSGISFVNRLTEDEDFNIIEYLYFFNGGGVSLGDINQDGLVDIYLSGNQVPNKMFLNKGDFRFEDITDKAGLAGAGNWKTGVSMVDINADGYLDLFVCGVGGYKKFDGRNQFFINNGDLTFTDRTKELGLDFQGFSTQAAFFDYDKDGDLDLYLLNHSVHSVRSYGDVSLRFQSDLRSGDKLFRNEMIPKGKFKFAEVTSQAGIFSSQIGYGLGVAISDVNRDGFPDIYVSNDFHENDYLYINQKDGTFKNRIDESMAHTSRFSMGNDVADINNDGRVDIVTLDMLPAEEGVLKTSAGEDPYEIFQFKRSFGYHYQVSRNCLQLNEGNLADGTPLFSDVAPLLGIEATDWSWAPLLADFDLDGLQDLFIANGIVRRPNDLDYINYISSDSAQRFMTDQQMIDRMPSGKVANYIFRNKGGLQFEDKSATWFEPTATWSNGAAYSDLDNDGDLDLVVNNINEEASLFRNETKPDSTFFLSVILKGSDLNKNGIGAKVILYRANQQQYREVAMTRGWQSSVDGRINFGWRGSSNFDSLLVIWPSDKYEVIRQGQGDQTITLDETHALDEWDYLPSKSKTALLAEMDRIDFVHRENDFTPFVSERLVPTAASTQGPCLATGFANADGLLDVFVGGGKGQSSEIFTQEMDGRFTKQYQPALLQDSLSEDTGALFFDANGDGRMDLLVAAGGQEPTSGWKELELRLYLMGVGGKLVDAYNPVSKLAPQVSVLKAGDYDGDGDSDVFVGSRMVAGRYGAKPTSYLLRNSGKGIFEADSIALPSSGMVTDAEWADVNRDGLLDLVVVGEWMALTILIQTPEHTFVDSSQRLGLANTEGWWNCVTAADFDADGDMDFVAGNIGQNGRLRASGDEPIELWVTDIDGNGSTDPILTYYNKHQLHPFVSRDQLTKQVPPLKRKFLRYENFRQVKLDDILPVEKQKGAMHLIAKEFRSVYLENGPTGFIMRALPKEAQFFPVFDFAAEDIDDDGHLDILAIGNLTAIQPEIGRMDAGHGIVLAGSGTGQFTAMEFDKSGFLVRGEGRQLAVVTDSKGVKTVIVSRNKDSVQTFKINARVTAVGKDGR